MLQSVVGVESFRALHTGECVLAVNLLVLQKFVLAEDNSVDRNAGHYNPTFL